MATASRTRGQSNKVVIDQHTKNDQLRKVFAAAIASGHPFIFAVIDSSNPEYKMLCVAQEKVMEFQKPTEAQKFFLGWDERDPRLVRVMQAAQAGIVEEQGFEPGQILEGWDISVVRLETPAYEDQEPVLNPETGENHLVNGKEVYEHRTLVWKGE